MPTGREILDALYKIIDELETAGDTDANALRKYVGQVADQFFPVDCTKCIYGAEDTCGGIVCANYGSEEHRLMGYCQCFEVVE